MLLFEEMISWIFCIFNVFLCSSLKVQHDTVPVTSKVPPPPAAAGRLKDLFRGMIISSEKKRGRCQQKILLKEDFSWAARH